MGSAKIITQSFPEELVLIGALTKSLYITSFLKYVKVNSL